MKKIVALAIFALAPAAWAQQHAALSEGGEPCVKAECESGQVANQCPQPVNFARCHAADLGGCLLTETVRIEAGEALPFACASGKIARVGGCFPPFIPVSVSGSEHICAPDPKDPDALAAANAQTPQAAPKPAPAAQAPAPAPKPECEMDSLLKAAEENNIAAVRCLIENGADVNAKTKYGYTSLHRAAWKGTTETAALLIENGADVNAKTNNGWAPMDVAIYFDRAEIQSLLSRHGGKAVRTARPSPKPAQEDNTASARTAQTPQAAPKPAPAPAETSPPPRTKTEQLLNAELNPFAADENGWTHLHWAALLDDEQSLRRLLEADARPSPIALDDGSPFSAEGRRRAGALGRDMNQWRNRGQTPVFVAATFNLRSIVSILAKHGAPIPSPKTEHFALGKLDANNERHLRLAAENNDIEAVRWLIANGADVNAKGGEYDRTPLHEAADKNATQAAELLIKNGADVNAKGGEYDRTPLHEAAGKNATQAAELLIKNGAKVNARNNKGSTPLVVAAAHGATETAAFLLKNGANVNAKTNGGHTSLHFATADLLFETAALLLKSGADVNAKDNEGYTPMDWALTQQIPSGSVQSLFRQYGGRCNTAC